MPRLLDPPATPRCQRCGAATDVRRCTAEHWQPRRSLRTRPITQHADLCAACRGDEWTVLTAG